MEELRTTYAAKMKEYDDTIKDALESRDATKVEKIRQLNMEIGKLLEKMIEQMTFLKQDTPLLKRERDILVEKLRRIQMDYNGLLVNTDELETLRRIREQEGGLAKRDLYRYLAFFFIVAIGIVLLLVFVRGQSRMKSTETSTSVPSTIPPLT
jgi:ribosomal 50S subunit-associated protein YjgA (DUF615 family)